MGFLARLLGSSDQGGTFLAPLSRKQKVKVSNLNPLIYDVIIKEDRGEDAPAIVGMDEHALRLLRKLEIADLEKLAESVQQGSEGDSAAARSDFAEAERHYKKAADINPYNDLALMSYGCALAYQGNLREGIVWVEKALKVNPKNQRARQNLKGMKAEL